MAKSSELRRAESRVIGGDKTQAAQARWLLAFIGQGDLAPISDAARADLEWDAAAFTQIPWVLSVRDRPVPFRDLCGWHEKLRGGFAEIRAKRVWRYTFERATHFTLVAHPALGISGQAFSDRSAADRFFSVVLALLGKFGRRVRFCERCGAPFLREGKQSYCSRGCSQAERTRRYRATHSEKVRRARRDAYRRRKQKVHGPGVKIQIRRHRARPSGPQPQLQ